MSDTIVRLGEFEFARFEIPEVIAFGGDQKVIVHELVGGTRVIDAMGEVPLALEWTGFFVGASALDRALYLDGQRKAGNALDLTWSELSYSVVIKTFKCSFQRFYRLPYSITCEVVTDRTSPIKQITAPSPEQAVTDDLGTANGLASGIGDGALSGLMSGLNSAITTVGKLATATQSAIESIALPLQAARDRVGILIQSTGLAISNAASLGGILPSNPISLQVTNLTGQIGVVLEQPALINLDRTLGRMANNLATIHGGTKTITVAGGDLYSIAASEYGDAMGWTALAVANRLADPSLAGIVSLTVPPFSNNTGGVLNG